MKLRIVLLGIAAFMLALLVVLPVQWVASLLPQPLQCADWRGSVWNGQCTGLAWVSSPTSQLQFDSVRWQLHPLALLRLSASADLQLSHAQGDAEGRLVLGRGGRLALHDVSLRGVLDRRLAAMLPAGWTGRVQAQHLALQLHDKRLLGLSGELQLHDLQDGRGSALGSYQLQFAGATTAPWRGSLRDAGGPIELAAVVVVNADRSWSLDGTVTPRPGAPASLLRSLEVLGSADTSGQRPISAAGSFN